MESVYVALITAVATIVAAGIQSRSAPLMLGRW